MVVVWACSKHCDRGNGLMKISAMLGWISASLSIGSHCTGLNLLCGIRLVLSHRLRSPLGMVSCIMIVVVIILVFFGTQCPTLILLIEGKTQWYTMPLWYLRRLFSQ